MSIFEHPDVFREYQNKSTASTYSLQYDGANNFMGAYINYGIQMRLTLNRNAIEI